MRDSLDTSTSSQPNLTIRPFERVKVSKVMSPRPSVLEPETEKMNLEEVEDPKPATFVISTGSDSEEGEKEKETVPKKEEFQTPEPGRKKMVAAKVAAIEKDKGGRARSSTDAGVRSEDHKDPPVERPLEQEATGRFVVRTEEERKQRVEDLKMEKDEEELQELRRLKKRLQESEAEMRKLHEEGEEDKKHMREQFDVERQSIAEQVTQVVQETMMKEMKNQRQEQEGYQ